jgi:hypothetical protein
VVGFGNASSGPNWGFDWNDDLPPGATLRSLRIEIAASLWCNAKSGPTNAATLNGVSLGELTFNDVYCSGCASPMSVNTFNFDEHVSAYSVGATNQFRIATGPNFEGITTNPEWGSGIYARVIVLVEL